jgi:hypothetical protein
MYLISLSQRHNAASVLELSRSLEFEHELRREVTLQVMRWFEQVDEADERRKMGVEKAVCQVGLGILRRWMVDFERLISFIFALIPRLIPTLFLVLYLQSDPISEDEFMTMKYRRRRCFYFQQIPQATHSKYPLPSFGLGSPLYRTTKIGKLFLRTFAIFLLENVDILLPLWGTFNRLCHAVRGPLSHTQTLEGRGHQAVSVGHRGRHERP